MIATITGMVTHILSQASVIVVHDIGYKVYFPARYQWAVGQVVAIFTFHHIKEDGQALYGFETMEELALFEQLITVSSIGPKLGLAILSAATPGEIVLAVAGDNVGFFQSISGVGKKSALKIIIELKGKLTDGVSLSLPSGGLALTDALTSLGYVSAEIQGVVGRVPVGLGDEEQVSWALRELARQ